MASSSPSPNPDSNSLPRALSKRPRLLVVSDLDWTMVDHDDKEHKGLQEFNALWPEKLSHDSLLVFSTGRSHALYEQLRKEVPSLAVPDVLICSVGTEIFFENERRSDGGGGNAAPVPDSRWVAALDATGWSRDAVAAAALASTPALQLQAESEQRPHKVSFHLEGGRGAAGAALKSLDSALRRLGFGTAVIYSGGVDVDVLPAGASKGAGLRFLLSELAAGPGTPGEGVVAAGDSGNDVELLAAGEEAEGEDEREKESSKGRVIARCPPGVVVRGVVVANAHPELRAWAEGKRGKGSATSVVFEAKERCARGIVEALRHFDLA